MGFKLANMAGVVQCSHDHSQNRANSCSVNVPTVRRTHPVTRNFTTKPTIRKTIRRIIFGLYCFFYLLIIFLFLIKKKKKKLY